jgi:hypothetical protein
MLPAHSYAYPAEVDGVRHAELVEMASDAAGCAPPHDLQAKHLWPEENRAGGTTWQTPGAVNAVEECGARGDGVADDWAALQRCLMEHEAVVLPKGFYRVSQPLVLTRGALVGVGRTLSFLVPTTAAAGNGTDWPLLDVAAADTPVHVGWLTFAVWDHLPHVYAVRWDSTTSSTWRQAFQNRVTEATFPPLRVWLDNDPERMPPAQRGSSVRSLAHPDRPYPTVVDRPDVQPTARGAEGLNRRIRFQPGLWLLFWNIPAP